MLLRPISPEIDGTIEDHDWDWVNSPPSDVPQVSHKSRLNHMRHPLIIADGIPLPDAAARSLAWKMSMDGLLINDMMINLRKDGIKPTPVLIDAMLKLSSGRQIVAALVDHCVKHIRKHNYHKIYNTAITAKTLVDLLYQDHAIPSILADAKQHLTLFFQSCFDFETLHNECTETRFVPMVHSKPVRVYVFPLHIWRRILRTWNPKNLKGRWNTIPAY